MAIRITSLNSGLDTESIITELVKAQKTKVDTIKKNQTTHQWKQEAWKELNSKALKLFNGTLGNMRFSDAYSKKVTKVSNSSAVSVVTGSSAVNGVQELKIDKLAKTGYLTGAKLNGNFTENSTLSSVSGGSIGAGESLSFSVTTGGRTSEINLSGSSKISDVVKQLKAAGLNANFDTANQRLFVSATTTGKDADFALTANDQSGFNALSALGINVMDSSSQAKYAKTANMSESEIAAWIDSEVTKQKTAVQSQIDSLDTAINLFTEAETAFYETYGYDENTNLDAEKSAIETRLAELSGECEDESEETARLAEIAELETKRDQIQGYQDSAAVNEVRVARKTEAEQKLAEGDTTIYNSVKDDVEGKVKFAQDVLNGDISGISTGANRIEGQDARIYLNGAEFTSKNNTFAINGLTFTAMQETGEDVITVTTQDDTDGIYDMVKSFIKEYNELINEMDKLYNAASAKDYKPLTDEEKEAMSESEIEKWEAKIKDSVLRRDSTLSTVSSAMKSIMLSGFTVNGKTMRLTDFGIETLNYFTAADNEKNAYHIDGDADDTNTVNNSDKLKSMIASDPATVTAFFTELSKSLYGKLNEFMMERNDGKSAYSLYNDKQMKKEYDAYTTKIAKQEEKVTAMEDKYYKQFSAMEVALAKMQSSQSAISGLLGM